jgi:hypothetical protein
MNKLDRIQCEIDQLRAAASNVRHKDLKRLAEALGRTRDTQRGKEPTFVNKERKWTPLSIPAHRTLAKGTVHSILDHFEDDLLWLREHEEGK